MRLKITRKAYRSRPSGRSLAAAVRLWKCRGKPGRTRIMVAVSRTPSEPGAGTVRRPGTRLDRSTVSRGRVRRRPGGVRPARADQFPADGVPADELPSQGGAAA